MNRIDPQQEDLIEKLASPLEGAAELHLLVQAELQSRLENTSPQKKGQDGVSEARERVRAAGQVKRRRWRWPLLILSGIWLLALLLEIPDLMLEDAWEIRFSDVMEKVTAGNSFEGHEPLFPKFCRGWARSKVQAIEWRTSMPNSFWAGNESQADATAHLWRAHPDSPAIYYAYVSDYCYQNHNLPDDFDEVWQRIDPQNGAWLAAKACVMADAAKEPVRRWHMEIVDPALFEQAVDTLDRALRMPRFDEYEGAQKELIGKALGAPHSYAEAHNMAEMISEFPRRFWVSTITLELLSGGHPFDQARFQRGLSLVRRHELRIRRQNVDETIWWGGHEVELFSEASYLAQRTEVAELPEEQKRLEELSKADALATAKPAFDLYPCQASELLDAFIDPAAGRLEWLKVGRNIRIVLLLLAGFAWILAALKRIGPEASKGMGICLEPLMGGLIPRILFPGILVPGLAIWIAGSWIPEWDGIGPLCSLAGASLAAAWATTNIMVSAAFTRRLGFLHLGSRRWIRKIDLLMVLLTWSAPVAFWFSAMLRESTHEDLSWIGWVMSGVPVVWLIGKMAASFWTRQGNLCRVLVARCMLPLAFRIVATLLVVCCLLLCWERWSVRQPGVFGHRPSPTLPAAMAEWDRLLKEFQNE